MGKIFKAEDLDPLFDEAIRVIFEYDVVGSSILQRKFSIGYARAARMMDQLEDEGVISEADGAKPRKILFSSYEEYLKNKGETPKTDEEEVEVKIPKYDLPDNSIFSEPRDTTNTYNLKNTLPHLKSSQGLVFPIGFNEDKKLINGNLIDLKNLIVTGNVNSEKMVFLDTFLVSLISLKTAEELRLIILDPLGYFNLYSGVPHLLTPIISEAEKGISALRWVSMEAQKRTKFFADKNVRSLEAYNQLEGVIPFPNIVFLINKPWFFAGIGIDFQLSLEYIIPTGYNCGIYFVIISDRLSKEDLPASVKSSIPNRIVFKTGNASDSKLADVKGADDLEKDELLFKNFQENTVQKLKTVYTSEENVKEIVKYIKDIITSSKE